MNQDAANAYLQRLGFSILPSQEGRVMLQPKTAFNDENWRLAWSFLGGKAGLVLQATEAKGPDEPAQGSHIQMLADRILAAAKRQGASDIHLQPREDGLEVRFRQDGHLVPQPDIGFADRDHLLAHLKIRAGMDIAEKRKPQDGRIRFENGGRSLDLRVSTLPSKAGEKMVLRLLDKSGVNLDLGCLGLDASQLSKLRRTLKAPHGLILVTGPTGSGKTTTLYSCLLELNAPSVNILTIEDPIEYDLAGITQSQVKPEIGVTFSSTLRAFLRQDPDIIMVGEIRDGETASLATRAALTGHLVLSTLHTNDAVSAVPRLTDLGVPGHLVSGCLSVVIAQRLLRLLCQKCRQLVPFKMPAGMQPLHPVPGHMGTAQGCAVCHETGFKGRRGIYEILWIDKAIRQAIHEGVPASELVALGHRSGLVSLSNQALAMAGRGDTSLEEALKETLS